MVEILSGLRRAATVLALAAMMVRALLPAGWMPGAQAFDGGAPIVICTTSGAQHILSNADGNPAQEKQDGGASHAPCAFASMATLSPPFDAGAVAPVLVEKQGSLAFAIAASVQTATVLAWRSRAPPSPTNV